MSFNIYLGDFDLNITHNTNGIVDACFGTSLVGKRPEDPDVVADMAKRYPEKYSAERPFDGYNSYAWGRLHGNTAAETRLHLQVARAVVEKWSDEFEKMLPANGWGTRETVTDAIRRASKAADGARDDEVWSAWSASG